MPPRTRANKTTKSLKENINVGEKAKGKVTGKVSKPVRKALADKTNSASDDNTSIEAVKGIPSKPQRKAKIVEIEVENVKPSRERRLPERFKENQVLRNLSQNNSITKTPTKPNTAPTPVKCVTESPFKTPQKTSDTSLLAPRPKRVCRLPSRLEDHSISPNKFIPVQPVQASTPKVQNKLKAVQISNSTSTKNKKTVTPSEKQSNNNKKVSDTNKSKENGIITIADTNNNARNGRPVRNRKVLTNANKIVSVSKTKLSKSPNKSVNSPVKKSNTKLDSKDCSFRILEDKKQKEIKEKGLDVYEFTYDPTEEPPPHKKKAKKVVKRKPAQPKTKQILYKNNYDKNVAKALSALKNAVSKKNTQSQAIPEDNTQKSKPESTDKVELIAPTVQVTKEKGVTASDKAEQNNTAASLPAVQNSIRIEDIAADFEPSLDHELNYSPINSPHPNKTTHSSVINHDEGRVPLNNQDPLNLKGNLSFFDDVPVASSSMNGSNSNRHPHASPWRVEFNNLPIKWHVNSYVKPNMTPAMECSFVNFNDNKKKHVYTNMVPEATDSLPEIVENDKPNLIQTSIISFIREVVEKNANKKRGRSATPKRAVSAAKENEAFNTVEFNKTPRKLDTPKKTGENTAQTPEKTSSNGNKENAEPNEKNRENLKRKLEDNLNAEHAKAPRKSNEKNNTFFGFDDTEDSENIENVSPKKAHDKSRTLRLRNRGVLKQINEQVRPTRASIPVIPKPANPEVVNKIFEEMKAASVAPQFPDEDNIPEKPMTNVIEEVDNELLDGDSDSVHLFEDIEVVHHMKQQRKSYGKAKKVAFRQNSDSQSDSQSALPPRYVGSDSEDDLADLTFELPNVKEDRKIARKKTKTKKSKMTKKEAEEAEAWAASFNSMCEDIDEFPLVVE